MPDLMAMVADLIGAHGRVEIAFRTAADAPPRRPQDRWQPVLQELHAAVGLVSSLAAGYTDPPAGYAHPAVPEPCGGCAGQTAMRIHGRPWHYTCWMRAGCPLTPAPKPEPAALESPAPGSTSTAGDVTADVTVPAAEPATVLTPASESGPESPPAARVAADTPPHPVQAASAALRAGNGGPEPARRFELSPEEELADWAREVRTRYPDATEAQCAAALAAWHTHVTYSGDRVRWVSSPGYTGVAVYEWLTGRRGAMVKPEPLQNETVLALTEARTTLQVLSFVDRDQDVALGQAVTETDVNAQYLAGARSAELGDGEPTEHGPIPVDDQPATFKLPGYVQLGSKPDLAQLPPTARLAFARVDAGWWLPTPTARYLQHDHKTALDIAAAWLWTTRVVTDRGRTKEVPAHGRRLAVWCGLFADARAALVAARDGGDRAAGVALQILKSVYATFLGGMTRSADHNDKGTLRPDWHDQYVTQANVNALRALDKARAASGVTPIGLMKDAAWWVTAADAAPFKPAGMEITERDGQPGKWHVNRWARVDQDIVTAHASGRTAPFARRSPRRTKPARRGASSGLPRSSARTRGHSDGRPRAGHHPWRVRPPRQPVACRRGRHQPAYRAPLAVRRRTPKPRRGDHRRRTVNHPPLRHRRRTPAGTGGGRRPRQRRHGAGRL